MGKVDAFSKQKDSFRKLNFFQVRKDVVKIWLSFLVENNPVYSNIDLDYIDFENDINMARDKAIESILIESDAHTLNTEQYVSSKLNEDPFVDSEGFQHIYLTNKNGHDSNDPLIHTKDFLNTLKDGMNSNPSDYQDEPPDVKIKPNTTPTDEFNENDSLIYGAFPSLFPVGQGLETCKGGSVGNQLIRKLLLHHDRIYAQTPDFMFLLFNQLIRHTAARSLGIKVKNNLESFQTVTDLIIDPDFDQKLDRALKQPDGPDAKQLLNSFKPHLVSNGSNIPFSASQRSQCLAQLVAYVRFFGPPSFFITISPSDVDSKLMVTLAKKHSGDYEPNASIGTSLPSLSERYKLLVNDPVAAAEVFYRTVESVMEELIGKIIINRFKTRI